MQGSVAIGDNNYPTPAVGEIVEHEPPIARADPDSLPIKARDLVSQSLDQANDHIVSEINDLQRQLEDLKEKISSDMEIVKEVVAKHFNVSAEALASAEKIKRRMLYLASGGPAE